MALPKKIETIREAAKALYVATLASFGPGELPDVLLPADAKRTLGKRYGVAPAALASYVDPVYFRENGLRNPLPLGRSRTDAALARAVRIRRDRGGTLGRWDTLAYSLSAALDTPVSETRVRNLYASVADIEASYTGRGTRDGAPKTRGEYVSPVGAEEDES